MIPRMPGPEIYEQEYQFWPWGRVIKLAASWIKCNAPQSSHVIDYMCGTGYLLNEIHRVRPDLKLTGCSLMPTYIKYARTNYPNINVLMRDAMEYIPSMQPGIIICMAGIHHLVWKRQPQFIEKVASELPMKGYFVVGEETIAVHRTLKGRKYGALQLGMQRLYHLIKVGATKQVVEAAIDVLGNDLLIRGEYKTSLRQLVKVLQSFFTIKSIKRIWPSGSGSWGDFLLICQKK